MSDVNACRGRRVSRKEAEGDASWSFVLAAQFPGQGQGEALHRAVRTAEVGEEAGLDSVWLAEHHFVPYGTCPSAVTLAGLLLGRTQRLRVGTAVSVLPNTHPVILGEQAALLHLLSGGRFSLGVGRGGPWVDLEVFGSGLRAYERDFPNRSTCCCGGCASHACRRTVSATASVKSPWYRGRTS